MLVNSEQFTGFEKRGNSEDAENGRVYGDDRS